MRSALLYFDFVSPFAYICLHRLKELPADLQIEYRPVLFAGLLGHWGQKGPAEIASKRRYTYRWCNWWAKRLGIPFRFPAGHPFNPLHHLRLAIACGSQPEAVRSIFDVLWTSAEDPANPTAFTALVRSLGVDPPRLASEEIKDALRKNTEQAAARGVFGVPTFEVDGELFWGADSIEFLSAFLADPTVLQNDEVRRLDGLPVAAARKA
ncbi:MAG TPA: 2-hydroxychromene-2-carboxylate isomerase [Burkholderiales bacterium]|jgi:2-hydroxychromene-2-carboxylate isomerase|nr:2-hydroxychromene-2-carboxylate isomerase [Burkholderiales bacterium]